MAADLETEAHTPEEISETKRAENLQHENQDKGAAQIKSDQEKTRPALR
jgi:hypothetical protein